MLKVAPAGKGAGYGKVILFGEHFVVHGCPAIVSALDFCTTVYVTEGKGEFESDQKLDQGQKLNSKQAIDLICELLKLDGSMSRVMVDSDVPLGRGMGSSAAFCFAAVEALTDFYNLQTSRQDKIDIARQAENIFHGSSSGMDVAVAALGGTIYFEKLKFPQALARHAGLHLVLADSGISIPTSEMVQKVKELKDQRPDQWAKIFGQACDLVAKAKKAIQLGELEVLGRMMDQNHELLQQLGVSSPKLDQIVGIARSVGTLGAKLTGGGGGGSVIALCSGQEQGIEVRELFASQGFDALYVQI